MKCFKKWLSSFLIIVMVALSAVSVCSCFEDDEDSYYDVDDEELKQLYYDYYGYYPDDEEYEDYGYDDDQDYEYYSDDDYYGYDDEDYADYGDDDYYDDDEYYEDDEDWASYLLELFGLDEDDYYDESYDDEGYYDDEYYGDEYSDDEYYDDSYSNEEYADNSSSNNSSSAYDYYFNDQQNTGSGTSSFYAVEDTVIENPEAPAGAADWTLFIYLCGSDLESNSSCGVTDLKEIAKSSIGSNVNVLIETGGSRKWHGFDVSSTNLNRFVLKNGKITKVATLPLASMGNPKTLSDFISWGAKNYPAKKYALDFWNHGSGSVYGVCFDENYPDDLLGSDSLLASELKQAFTDAGVSFEIFIFDTCLSATIEMADTLSNYGKYMVASEEVVLSACLSYDKWISSLSSKPEQTGAQLGRQIAELYSTNMRNAGYSSSCTMSVLDLSRINRVKLAFQAMASQMTQKTQNVTSFRNLIRSGAKGVKYGSSSDNEGYTNLIDLGEFAQNAAAEVPEQAQALIKEIKNAVLFEVHGKDEGNSCGIAVYYPVKYIGDTSVYADNVDNRPYLQYLDAILENWSAPQWVYKDKKVKAFKPVKSASYDVEFSTFIENFDEEPRYALNISNGLDSVDFVTMNLYWYDEEAKEFLYLGNDNNINGDWDSGVFYDNFDGTWITIDDCYVNAELIEASEDANYYSVPVELNGKDTNLRLKYSFTTGKYKLIGAYDGIENGTASKGMRHLKEGDKLAFVFYAVSEDSDEDDEATAYIGGETTYSKNIVIEDSDLFDGLYYYQYEIQDIFGNVKYSDFAEMECSEGYIYINVDEE
ncbi:MAG: hypothetical protein K5681_01275 [Treponema sp.]|nr:hypothetical protein [Treponema sp.]